MHLQVLNAIALVLTFWVAIELNKIRGKSSNANGGKADFKQMAQVRKEFAVPSFCFFFL